MHDKAYVSQLIPTYQIFCTWITPAAGTKSVGLQADLPTDRQARSWQRFLLFHL
jgi:hypothetical protein